MSTYRKQLTDLYTPAKLATHNARGTNARLWLDKYIKNQHQDDNESRSELVRQVSEIALTAAYKQFYQRWQHTLRDCDAKPCYAKTDGRMIVGLGDESVLEASIALHHTYGVPYIPGSALKGLAASYARQRLGEKWKKESVAYNIVFGNTDDAGYVTFFDALLHVDPDKHDEQKERPLHQDIITVHHPDYYQGTDGAPPSDWDSPTPIPFLSATGTYLIALAAPDLHNGEKWINKTFAILRYALKEMGIGAKTSSGYGRMTLDQIEEDEDGDGGEAVAEVVPEKAFISLQRRIANASQMTYELFAAWEQLPAEEDDEDGCCGKVVVAREMVKRMDEGKKRTHKEEKRYKILKSYIDPNN